MSYRCVLYLTDTFSITTALCCCRESELSKVAQIQAEAFYEPLPLLGPFNRPLLYGFQAEVLSGVRTKTTYAARDGFQCLVAEDANNSGSIVGVVEVSLQSGKVNSSPSLQYDSRSLA